MRVGLSRIYFGKPLVPNLFRGLFCLDLQTHTLVQKLSFLPFFLIKLKIPAYGKKKKKNVNRPESLT